MHIFGQWLSRRSWRRAPTFGLVLLLGAASSGLADYRTDFAHGIKAHEEEAWQEAAAWFQKAIDAQPKAGGKVRVDGKRELYVPYYYLGLSLYYADDLRGASRAWRTAREQDVWKKKMERRADEYLVDIQTRLNEIALSAKGTSTLPPAGPTSEMADNAASAEEAASRMRAIERQLARAERRVALLDEADVTAVLRADATLAKQRDNGLELLRHARKITAEADGTVDPVALAEIHALATRAAVALEQVVAEALEKLKEQ